MDIGRVAEPVVVTSVSFKDRSIVSAIGQVRKFHSRIGSRAWLNPEAYVLPHPKGTTTRFVELFPWLLG